MTTTLEHRRAPAAPPPPVRRPLLRTFLAQWRVALRLARRDAWRSKGRSLLVLALVAVPVTAVAGVDIYVRTTAAATTPQAVALASLGAEADALLTTTGSGDPLQQGWAGNAVATRDPEKSGSTSPVPTTAQLLALLPQGSRLVDPGTAPQAVLEHAGWGVVDVLRVQEVSDPVLAGFWRVREGRLPASTSEVALSPDQARRLHAAIGDSVLVTPSNATDGPPAELVVVGVAEHVTGWPSALTLPGTFGGTTEGQFLAEIPGGLDWAGVRRLNDVGVVAASRAVLESPPPFCRLDSVCLDSAEAVGSSYTLGSDRDISAAEAAEAAALAAVVTVIVVLQVALLAGPAFAVQLRRRQRELGLVGASGGDAATLRRTVLASGVVLGSVGAVLGVALAWSGVLLLGGALPVQPLADLADRPLGIPVLPPELLGVVLVGVLAATAGALVPAVAAGRGDVVDSLHGRRALPAVRRGVPVAGVILGAVGLAILAYGVAQNDGVVLGIGIIVGQLGVVVTMPALVSWFARSARWLPLAGRLAVRDAGRHRMRTTAAACAIAATAAVAVGASAAAQTAALEQASRGRPFLAGTQTLLLNSDPTTTDATGHAARVAELTALATAAVPGASVAVLAGDLRPADAPNGGDISCVAPERPGPDWDPAFRGCEMAAYYYGSQLQLVADAADLDQLLGPLAPVDGARETLEAGGVVVLARNAVDADGRVTLSLDRWDESGQPAGSRTVSAPGFDAGGGAVPATFLIGPAALAPGGFLFGEVENPGLTSTVAVLPAAPDRDDQPTAQDRLLIAVAKAGITDVGVVPADQPGMDETLVLGLAAAATAALAVLVGLMITALALVDGRADLVTLASVGAPPGVRRRMAAASAGFVSGLGCLVGAVTGLVGVVVLMPLITSGAGLVVLPWATVAVVVLVVPLLTMAVAWMTTRSRVPLVRREAV